MVSELVCDNGALSPLIHGAVARHAATAPESTALIHEGRRIDYRTLDAAANAYAVSLAERGVRPGQVVPLLLPRSPQLVAVQLAVLKCGAAYAGLDLRWPADRLAVILDQVSPALAVGREEDRERDYHADGVSFWCLAAEDIPAVAARAAAFEPVPVTGSAPATVFFTSGTTGGPKGVVCPHRAVTRLFQPGGLRGFGPGHATPQAAPLPWDMYAFELWGQLTSGGTSVLVEHDYLLPGVLSDLVRTAGVDTLWLTTSLFNLFMDEAPDCFSGLAQVLSGGEKLSPAHVRRFLQHHPAIPLWNGYGPAENCMLTTTRLIRPEDCDVPGGIPVGTAVPGTTVLVLDEAGRLCSSRQPGEICIAGQGLACGYLGQAELTAAKFPTVELDGSPLRIYRTGDIGVTDGNGTLHFLGRQDRQVKISGHRVEMAEVEVTARGLTGIYDCVALPVTQPDGRVSRLALFYLTDPDDRDELDGTDDPLKVRDQLLRMLPGYLVPGVVSWMERFPVTANGKLDSAELLRLARRPPRPGRLSLRRATAPAAGGARIANERAEMNARAE